jgi:hypothetical protein
MNATERSQRYRIDASGLKGLAVATPSQAVDVGPAESRWVAVRLQVPAEDAPPGSHTVFFNVQSADGASQVSEKAVFLIPR